MKKYFIVTFKDSDNVYCSNIAHAETAQDVKRYYSIYEWVNVTEAQEWDLETAREKGMPIEEIEKEMTRYEKIKEVLESMDTADIITVHNEYCDASNDMDDYIYDMDEFDDIMNGQTPWEVARAAFYGDFCPAMDFFRFNAYGNLESFDIAPGGNSGICIEDIAQYIDDNEDALNNDDMQNVLDEYEEEEK